MKKVTIDGQPHHLPTSYSELTARQLYTVSFIYQFHLLELNERDQYATKIVLFAQLCTPKIPSRIFRTIVAAQWADILPHLNWIYEDAYMERFPAKHIRGFWWRRKLIAPVGMLDHSSMEEMVMADSAFVGASNDKDVDQLYLLFAILFRPVRRDLAQFKKSDFWNGDEREPFNLVKCEARVKWIKRFIPFHKVVAVFIYYQSFHINNLHNGYENVFDGDSKAVRVGNQYGWAGVMLEMANTKFGDLQKVKVTQWEEILVEMSRQVDIQKSFKK